MPNDIIPAGTDLSGQDPNQTIQKKLGSYKDPVEGAPAQDLTLESSTPKAPDPKPFALGPLGGR